MRTGVRGMKGLVDMLPFLGSLGSRVYAHENECPWDEKTCSLAAENGHLECLKYCLLYTSPSPRDRQKSRMPSSA